MAGDRHDSDTAHEWKAVGVYTTTASHNKPKIVVQCRACGIIERWPGSKASLYEGWGDHD